MVNHEDIEDPRRRMIREYIIDHPSCTKTEVTISFKGKSAVATTHKIIQKLISDGIIIMSKDEKNSQIHHLFINTKNEFNCLKADIAMMYEIIRDYNTTIDNATGKKLIMNSQCGKLVHFVQLVFYTKISQLANAIDINIQQINDREILYLRLIQVLVLSTKLNETIAPALIDGLKPIKKQIERLKTKTDKQTLSLFEDTDDIIKKVHYCLTSNQYKLNRN